MTPSARLQAVVEILTALDGTGHPADRFLRDWFRARHFMGSKDRAAVSERLYDVLRHRASYGWRMSAGEPRALVIASLLAEGMNQADIENFFMGAGYGPSPLSEEEKTVIASPPSAAPPPHVSGEYPQWLEPELERVFGSALADEMQALLARASVDLRVNTLRASRDDMLVGLRSLGIDAEPTPFAPHGIRIPSASGLSVLRNTQFFQTGAFEFQDEASQIVALLCNAKPGDFVLDLAAGAGGKSLAIAAQMQNKGSILAHDTDLTRLKHLSPRALRAGVTIISTVTSRAGPKWGDGTFDVVLVDAPCSGSGAWRRNPETKWRLTPDRLAEHTKLQSQLLAEGAQCTKPGGRLVYATCSLLQCENEEVIVGFLALNPRFRRLSAAEIWQSVGGSSLPPGMDENFRSSPLTTGTDGFFTCIMQHAS